MELFIFSAPTRGMKLLPTVALSIVLTVLLEVQETAAGTVSCGRTKNGDVRDKIFHPGGSGITQAKLHCLKEKAQYCDFGKDADGKAVKPYVFHGQPCGLNNAFTCYCLEGSDHGEAVLLVEPTGNAAVSCGATVRGYVPAANFDAGESGITEASVYCSRDKPFNCYYTYSVDSSIEGSSVITDYGKKPQPCGRNNEYLCYCRQSDAASIVAVLSVRKNSKAAKDS